MSLKFFKRPFSSSLKEFVPTIVPWSQQRHVNSDNVKISFEIFASFDIYKIDVRELFTTQLPSHFSQPKAFTKHFIHSFIVYSYCLEQSVLSGWDLLSKSVVCVFTTILKFKSIKVFSFVIPKLSQTAQEILPLIHKVL